MYHTRQTTSDTRNTLQSDPNSNSQPYQPNPESLPSIASMSLPGLPPSRPSPDSRAALNANLASSSSTPHPYAHSHSYTPELDYSSTRSHYGANSGIPQLNYLTRDNRLPSQSDHYYHSNMPLRPPMAAEGFVSQLGSALLPGPHGPSDPESRSSRSPEQLDEEDDTVESRGARREKPRIELAPDQPLTTQGKPRARVYVACVQCRTRKIRCDGAKPQCHNCSRRSKNGDDCSYDAVPKRRGPDKTPGARQRMAREARAGSEGGVIAARRRRRNKHEMSSNTHSDQTVNTDLGGHQPHSNPPISFSNISTPVIDPQLTGMSLFPTEASVGSNSFQPLPLHIPTDAVALVAPSDHEALYHMTSTQDTNNGFGFSTELDLQALESSSRSPPRSLITSSSLDNETSEISEEALIITPEPSLDFTRKTWWDSLLAMYTSSSSYLPSINLAQRQHATNLVTADIRFLLRGSNYWFSFINVPQFFGTYYDSVKRERMQPALLPAVLAIATLFQSSEAGYGKEGRDRALRLRDVAQGHLEASLNARWIDDSLAQAAWLLAFFEICPHPQYTTERSASAILMLDMIIRCLSLTFLDLDNPHSSKFSRRSVPTIAPYPWNSHQALYPGDHLISAPSDAQPRYPSLGCSCSSMTLGVRWPGAYEHTPLWVTAPGWDESWTEIQIRKELCRRLCWSALSLVSGHTSYITASNRIPAELFLIEPANYTLLFPGEALGMSTMTSHHSGKDTIWALIYRTMLLWHSCLQIRHDSGANEAEMARFGVDAWLEADTLEKAFDAHTCDLEKTFLFQGREYLFNVRMTVSHEFRRFIPLATANANGLFNRNKAEEWLTHQASVAQRAVLALGAVTGNATHSLTQRPFFIFWFMSQISRALTLWDCDNSLTLALDVCMAFFKPVDYLNAIWPCEELRRRAVKLREQVAHACKRTGRAPPSPPPAEFGTVRRY